MTNLKILKFPTLKYFFISYFSLHLTYKLISNSIAQRDKDDVIVIYGTKIKN